MKTLVGVLGLALGLQCQLVALDAEDLSDLVGFTIVAASNVKEDFEGAEHGKLVEFDNGMIFRFREYKYSYAYRPAVVVFSRTISIEELKKLLPSKVHTRPLVLYRLVIEEELYDVERVR